MSRLESFGSWRMSPPKLEDCGMSIEAKSTYGKYQQDLVIMVVRGPSGAILSLYCEDDECADAMREFMQIERGYSEQ